MQHRLTPQFILDRLALGQTAGTFDATCLFVDISGFTPLTVTLMEHGTEGAEVLADVLVAVFEPLIDAVYQQGGFIAGFAGDAFKAVFPIDDGSDKQAAIARALLAAWAIRTHLVDAPRQITRLGEFTFSGKVCVASGPVDWAIWQEKVEKNRSQRAASLFSGDGLAQAMAIDPYANVGQVIITEALAHGLPDDVMTKTPVENFLRVETFDAQRLPVGTSLASPTPSSTSQLRAADFYPQWLLSSPLQGEFRQVVTMFVNFERSFDPTELVAFQITLFRLVDQYDGFLGRIGQIGGKDNGNTLLLFWGAPTGSEHDVERALGFILDLQEASPVRLRSGVTTRMAYAGFVGSPRAEEYTCYGSYVNLAARQLIASGWGEIWLDDESARQAARRFQTERRGAIRFKGFADPQPVFTLSGRLTSDQQAFYAGALVGRRSEIDSLKAGVLPIFDGAFAGVVFIEGEAGLGKSRLVHEYETASGSMVQPPRWFLCQTDDILRHPLNPFRYWLRHYFGQSRDASEQANRAAFDVVLDALLDDLRHPMPGTELACVFADELNRLRSFLAALVDLHWEGSLYAQLEPQLRLDNMLDALKTLVKAESLVQPVILLLEDAHWLDNESSQFIDQLTRNVDGFPFALIVTRRPVNVLEKLVSDDVLQTVIQLTGLDDGQVGPIATALLDGSPSPELAALIAARAGGNPFFVEQITLYLREHKMIAPSEDGWQLTHSDQEATTLLPTDVRSLLTARLDRLPPMVREVVQAASVLGREFDRRVLSVMLEQDAERAIDSSGDHDHRLAKQMMQADRAMIWAAINEVRYIFRHALLRDAAYDMQLRARLRRLHSAAAQAVSAVYAGEPAPHYAELVHHYHQAEARDEERTYAGLAGEFSAQRYANQDALRFLDRAIELTDETDAASVSQLLLKHEDVAYTSGDRATQQADLDRLSALVEETEGDESAGLRAEILLRVGNYARVVNDYDRAIEVLQFALDSTGQLGDERLLSQLHNCLGKTYWRQNLYEDAAHHLSRALTLAESLADDAQIADNLYHLGLIDYYRAEYAGAMELFEAAHRKHADAGDQKGICVCLSMFGAIHNDLGDYAAAQENYDAGLEICRAIGWRHTEAHYHGLIGNNHLDVGQHDLAAASHNNAITLTRELGDREGEALSLDVLGLIAHEQGRFPDAVDLFEQAIEIQESIGDRSGLGYSLTHCGYTLVAMEKIDEAADLFERAISLRRSLGENGPLMDSLAGAASTAHHRGDQSTAVETTLEIMAWIDANDDEGIEYPIQVYLIAFLVFQAASEAEENYATVARSTLERGFSLLQERAEAVLDQDLRDSYLNNVSFNRELRSAWLSLREH